MDCVPVSDFHSNQHAPWYHGRFFVGVVSAVVLVLLALRALPCVALRSFRVFRSG